jgi:hypothetical protein
MGDDIQLLFREVADLSPREREQYFDHREVPSHLRVEVESLLRFDMPHAESLTGRVAETVTQLLDSDTGPGEGGRCGPYELVHLIGRGGMGAVFLAKRTDGEVEQRVAMQPGGCARWLRAVPRRSLRGRNRTKPPGPSHSHAGLFLRNRANRQQFLFPG